jgi:peptide/nickel transport system substrate-binding protein
MSALVGTILRSGIVLSAFLLFAACARSEAQNETGRHSWTIPHVLRIVSSEEPDSLNPIVGYAQTDVHVSMFWAGYLFNWSDRNRFVPELATVLPTVANHGVSADGKTITYHLRRGVRWQDGVPFTADDLIFSYRAVMNPRNAVQSRSGYELITRIEKAGDATVVIHLKRAWAPFTATFFTMSAETYPVMPRHLLAGYPDMNRIPYNEQPIGTGPFKLVKWDHGENIRFVANPNYWRGRPKLDEVDYQIVPNENTILTKLQTHEADLVMNASQSLIASYRQVPGVTVELNPDNQYVFYDFNLANPILADQRVREALVLATDRVALIDNVTHGVQIAGEGDQAPYNGWSAHIPLTRYDPARARQLLDDAGWHAGSDGIRRKNGQRLALTMAYETGTVAATSSVLLTQRWWYQIGVDLTVKDYLPPVFGGSYTQGGILLTGKWDVALTRWYNGVDPDDSILYRCDQFPPAGWNISKFCDPRVQRAEDAAIDSIDQAARVRAYGEISRLLVADRPFETLWFVRNVNVYNSDLKNFHPAHAVTEIWNPWQLDI